ncbi:hypothetical protein AVEN_187271-1 [Araneus ventricosus]|uniref:Uncharacterized protein n=1 Tax=Araneus ventricosus TaxID=182803 RepID=A0A4Y2KCH5_ARAVE|nr:hypothetical protein AVEN_187271-1 [Araneus ventricosus]
MGYCFRGRLTTAKRDERTRPKDLIRTMPLKRSRRLSPAPLTALSFLSRTCPAKRKVGSETVGGDSIRTEKEYKEKKLRYMLFKGRWLH